MSNPESIVNISNVRKPGYKKRRLNLIISIIIFTLIILGAYLYISPENGDYYLKDYNTEEVKIKNIKKSVSLTGTIKISKNESFSSIIDGICRDVYKEQGSAVIEDEVILVIESETLNDEKKEIENELKKLKREILISDQELKRKERDLKRALEKSKNYIIKSETQLKEAEELFKLNSITVKELDEYKDSLLQKKEDFYDLQLSYNDLKQDMDLSKQLSDYDLENTLSRLNKINNKIEDLKIKSSFTGTVLDLNIKKSEKVNSGSFLVQVGDLNTPYIEIYIPVKFSEDVKEGANVEITYENINFSGIIKKINPFVTIGSNGEKLLYSEIILLDKFDNYILGGSIGCEIIISDIKDQLTISRGEYIISGNNRFVYQVVGNKAVKKHIKYGVINNSLVSVVNGLKAGDIIITSSYDDFIDKEEIYLK